MRIEKTIIIHFNLRSLGKKCPSQNTTHHERQTGAHFLNFFLFYFCSTPLQYYIYKTIIIIRLHAVSSSLCKRWIPQNGLSVFTLVNAPLTFEDAWVRSQNGLHVGSLEDEGAGEETTHSDVSSLPGRRGWWGWWRRCCSPLHSHDWRPLQLTEEPSWHLMSAGRSQEASGAVRSSEEQWGGSQVWRWGRLSVHMQRPHWQSADPAVYMQGGRSAQRWRASPGPDSPPHQEETCVEGGEEEEEARSVQAPDPHPPTHCCGCKSAPPANCHLVSELCFSDPWQVCCLSWLWLNSTVPCPLFIIIKKILFLLHLMF